MEPSELARRLVGSGKPINEVRVRKMLRFVTDVQHFEATLAAIPDSQREQVRTLAGPLVRRKFPR